MLLECWKIQDSQGREKHALTCRSQPIPTHGDQLLNLCESCKSVVSLKVKVKVTQWCPFFVTPLTMQSVEFSRPEYWSGWPFPSPTALPSPGLPHHGQILWQLSHKGSPRLLEWLAYPFSRGSSWPRDWSGVSCTAGRFFTNGAITEAPVKHRCY